MVTVGGEKGEWNDLYLYATVIARVSEVYLSLLLLSIVYSHFLKVHVYLTISANLKSTIQDTVTG